jgi:hypothetical protein
MSRGGRTLRSALAAALAAAWPGVALADKLDKAACANLVSELATITASGARADMERGPEWAKANLAPDRMQSIHRMLEIDDQLEFRCGGRNAVARLKQKDNNQGPANKQPDDKQSGQPAPGGAAVPVTPSPAAAPTTPGPGGAPTSPVAVPQQRTTAPALVVTKAPVPINPAPAAPVAPAAAAPPAAGVPPLAVAPAAPAQAAVAPPAPAGPVAPAAVVLPPASTPAAAPPASTGAMPPPAASVTVPATPKAPQPPPVAAVTPALPPAVAPPPATPPVAKLNPTPGAVPPTAARPAPGAVPAAATLDPAAKAAARKKSQRRKPSSAYVSPNEVSPYGLPGMR